MNTGTPESGYGYWFPGERNDGAVGMAFVSAKSGMTWIRKRDERGAWRYDGEIDLGLSAAFHTARTVLVDDDVFGLHVLGGSMTQEGGKVLVRPSDGVLRQFSLVLPGRSGGSRRVHLSLDRDGFSESEPIVVEDSKGTMTLTLANHSDDAHATRLEIRTGGVDIQSVTADGRSLEVVHDSIGCSVAIPMDTGGCTLRLRYK